jgi:exodeoxyribonuclease V alpha subunit
MQPTPDILPRLSRSKFRSRFTLDAEDREYIEKIGIDKIKSHAEDFITKRLASENPPNDGKQTPFKGHPVFKAQHATATCCRDCLQKWHAIPKDRSLNHEEIDYVVMLIMRWIAAGRP